MTACDGIRFGLGLALYRDSGQTLGELCGHLKMTPQAVSKHFALLEAANLVTSVWRGRENLHYLNPVPIHEISVRWIDKFEDRRLRMLHDLKPALKGTPDESTVFCLRDLYRHDARKIV